MREDDVETRGEVGDMYDELGVQVLQGERAGAGDLYLYFVAYKGVSAAAGEL